MEQRQKVERNKYHVGNVVAVHFDSASAIGYNGTQWIVWGIEWSARNGEWKYFLKSIRSGGYVSALEHELRFVAERHVEPYYGPCTIEIGD